MRKRLICLLLIFIIAFSLSACNVIDNEATKGDETGSVDNAPESSVPDLDEKLGDKCVMPDFDVESDYTVSDFGEKGYLEYLYEGNSSSSGNKGLINSVAELKEFCESAQIREMYLSKRQAGETESEKFSERLSLYSTKYFEENALIIIFRSATSGSHWYSVKNVEMEGNAVNVTLQYWRTAMGTDDMKYWGIIIECPKSDVDELNVVTETKEQQRRPSGIEIHLGLTHEASLDTIYQTYTAEDFSELDFDFIVEEFSESSEGLRAKIGQLLIEHPLEYWEKQGDYWNRATIMNYTRMLVIKLTVESTDNVLCAAELLGQRADVKWAEPSYEYYFEID